MSENFSWALLGTLTFLFLLTLISLVWMMRQQQKSLSDRDAILMTLTNLVASRDPMTFSTLQANSIAEEPIEYVSKSDEDEASQWESLTNAGGVDGGNDDYTDDLRELGLSR
jgi:hypothetical protein